MVKQYKAVIDSITKSCEEHGEPRFHFDQLLGIFYTARIAEVFSTTRTPDLNLNRVGNVRVCVWERVAGLNGVCVSRKCTERWM